MATVATLITNITANNTQFKKSLTDSSNAVNGFSNKAKLGIAAVAAVVAGAAVGAFSALINVMSEAEQKASDLVDTATRLGAGIPELQRLQYAAKQSGIDLGSMNGALGKLLKNVGLAASGTGPAAQAFEQLGLSAKELAGLGVDQQYIKISQAIQGISSPAQQAALATQIFGKGGIEQLSLLKEDVQGLVKEFQGLGIELSTDQAQSLETYGDSVSTLGTVWEGFKLQLAAALSGPLKKLLDWVINSSTEMGGMQIAATRTALAIVSGFGATLKVTQIFINQIDYAILALDKLGAGFAKILSFGWTGELLGIDYEKNIKILEEDAAKRIASLRSGGLTSGAQEVIMSAQQDLQSSLTAQQKVQVEIKAAPGFIAEVVNSPENVKQITTTVGTAVNDAARQQ